MNTVDLEILNEIKSADLNFLKHNKDSNGTPYLQHIFRLHYKLFGETCTGCAHKIDGYINRIKKFNPITMEKSKNVNFKLKDMVMIPIPGTSESYSNANLTDEIAVELIAKNENRKQLFSILPKDLDQRIEDFKKTQGLKNDVPSSAIEETNLVKIGKLNATVEEALALLEKLEIKTKAKKAESIQKFIDNLSDDVKEKVIDVFALDNTKVVQGVNNVENIDVKEAKIVNESVVAVEKTLEELQFEHDTLLQEKEDLLQDGASVDELIIIDTKIKESQDQIDALKK